MKKLSILYALLMLVMVAFSQPIQKVKIAKLEKIIRESKAPMVVNFWATYCKPCLEEIPYFQRLVKKYKNNGVTLLLVSLDLKEDYNKISPTAVKRNIDARIVWLNETNADYFCPKVDSAWSGSLPATLFVNNRIGYRKFYERPVKEDELEKEIMAILRKQN